MAGLGIRDRASNDEGGDPDEVMACCGDIPMLETLAAVKFLRDKLLDHKAYIHRHGEDMPGIRDWKRA